MSQMKKILFNILFAALSLAIAAAQVTSSAAAPPPGSQNCSITMENAVDLAVSNSPSIKAALTQIDQSRSQEITASLRPNPTLQGDGFFFPIFNPGAFNTETVDQIQQFDLGVGYLFERGHKRQRRIEAARDQTVVTRLQVQDMERTLALSVNQQFIAALLARSNVEVALDNLESFRKTVDVSSTRYKAGDISQGDYLKIKLQMLQFETDLSSARIAEQQAFVGLRQLVGFNAMSASCKLQGQLTFEPLPGTMEEAERAAIGNRPDLEAARKGIDAARSQLALARANGKQDVNGSLSYSHTSGLNTTSFAFSVPLPIFNRNQGEIERARFAQTQAEFTTQATQDSVLKDVELAYEQAKASESIVDLYRSGYLDQAKQSRDISEFAFRQGAASLLDFLDATRNYRATEFAYHQALANYLLALHQLRQAQGFIK